CRQPGVLHLRAATTLSAFPEFTEVGLPMNVREKRLPASCLRLQTDQKRSCHCPDIAFIFRLAYAPFQFYLCPGAGHAETRPIGKTAGNFVSATQIAATATVPEPVRRIRKVGGQFGCHCRLRALS